MSRHETPHRRHVDHLQRRQSDTPRRRQTDPTPRRRKEDSKKANSLFGAIVTTAVALLFLAYVFNVQGFATAADNFFSNLDASAKSQNANVVSLVTTLLPLLGLLIGALILVAITRWILRGAKKSSKNRALAGRKVITIEHFREVTAARGILPSIANQAYTLLLPHYSRSMRVRLDDTLRNDLQLTDTEIADLLGNLLLNTNRQPRVGDAQEVSTVIDLLRCVQDAQQKSLPSPLIPSVAPAEGTFLRPRLGHTPRFASPAASPADAGEPNPKLGTP
jgi:hypothetical protein